MNNFTKEDAQTLLYLAQKQIDKAEERVNQLLRPDVPSNLEINVLFIVTLLLVGSFFLLGFLGYLK